MLTFQGLATGVVFFLLALVLSRLIARVLRRVRDRAGRNAPAIYVLEKLSSYGVLLVGTVMALQAAGLNLSSLAVFAGAIGIGVGPAATLTIGRRSSRPQRPPERPPMSMSKTASALAAGALLLSAGAAAAQTPYNQTPSTQSTQSGDRSQEAFTAILGALFGDRLGVSSSLESEWSRGRRPLATQRTQFETRLNTDVRSGQLTSASAARLRTDYNALVDLEARYTADGRVTTQERADLAQRYRDFSQRLAAGSDYQDGRTSVSDGRAEFERRVDAAVSARRLTRTEGNRLKSDYYALVQVESGYLRDGRLISQERDDLDARLDALDARVGDTGYGGGNGGGWQDPRARLSEIERALPRSGLSSSAQAQLRVELGDLTRLEAAYARARPSSDDTDYLNRRLGDLETRARVRR